MKKLNQKKVRWIAREMDKSRFDNLIDKKLLNNPQYIFINDDEMDIFPMFMFT